MSELDQLKELIDDNGKRGVATAFIREDYDPVGDMFIRDLCATEEYVQRKVGLFGPDQEWKIFKKGMEPY